MRSIGWKGLVGDAQARITVFQRAVDQLTVPDDTRPPFSSATSTTTSGNASTGIAQRLRLGRGDAREASRS